MRGVGGKQIHPGLGREAFRVGGGPWPTFYGTELTWDAATGLAIRRAGLVCASFLPQVSLSHLNACF